MMAITLMERRRRFFCQPAMHKIQTDMHSRRILRELIPRCLAQESLKDMNRWIKVTKKDKSRCCNLIFDDMLLLGGFWLLHIFHHLHYQHCEQKILSHDVDLCRCRCWCWCDVECLKGAWVLGRSFSRESGGVNSVRSVRFPKYNISNTQVHHMY